MLVEFRVYPFDPMELRMMPPGQHFVQIHLNCDEEMTRKLAEFFHVLDAFRDKIEALSGKVAKQLELQAVFDRGRGGPTLYFDEAVDVSSQVIEECSKTYP